MEQYYNRIIQGNSLTILKEIPDKIVQAVVTSPPYWNLRDYGHSEQIGREDDPDHYVSKLTEIFCEIHRILCDDGTIWLNIGDSYASSTGKASKQNLSKYGFKTGTGGGHKHSSIECGRAPKLENIKAKDLIGIPWMVAFALQRLGYYLRQDIIWYKTNAMPESVKDRCTKAHEYIFLLSKNYKYYFDAASIEEPAKWEQWGNQIVHKETQGTASHIKTKRKEDLPIRETKNRRSVWPIATIGCSEAHVAIFPPELAKRCILAGSRKDDVVLDPFVGSGTTAIVAKELGRKYIGIDINSEYCQMTERRLKKIHYTEEMF